MYTQKGFGITLNQAAYAFDSTKADLFLSLFIWAHFRQNKAAIKIHTLMDLRGGVLCFICVSIGKAQDIRMLDQLALEPGFFCIMDRAYTDFRRLNTFTQNLAFFIPRAKANFDYTR